MAEALLDSNVVVSVVAKRDARHAASIRLFLDGAPGRFAVADHSFAEAFVTLTKLGGGAPYAWSSAIAWSALSSLVPLVEVIGLSPEQRLDAIRRYAESGGTGARLYDQLIGEAAREAGLSRIVTWNVKHLRGLFPDLNVLTPAQV